MNYEELIDSLSREQLTCLQSALEGPLRRGESLQSTFARMYDLSYDSPEEFVSDPDFQWGDEE